MQIKNTRYPFIPFRFLNLGNQTFGEDVEVQEFTHTPLGSGAYTFNHFHSVTCISSVLTIFLLVRADTGAQLYSVVYGQVLFLLISTQAMHIVQCLK